MSNIHGVSICLSRVNFFESVKNVETSVFEAVGQLEDFVNKQLKHQK